MRRPRDANPQQGHFRSRDSQFGQRIGHALAFEFGNGIMDGLFERGGVGEGLVGEVIGFEIVPDRLDIIGVTW
jgi:hypothetical protein